MRKSIELHLCLRGKGGAKKDVRDYRQDMLDYIVHNQDYNSHEQNFELQDKPKPQKAGTTGVKFWSHSPKKVKHQDLDSRLDLH